MKFWILKFEHFFKLFVWFISNFWHDQLFLKTAKVTKGDSVQFYLTVSVCSESCRCVSSSCLRLSPLWPLPLSVRGRKKRERQREWVGGKLFPGCYKYGTEQRCCSARQGAAQRRESRCFCPQDTSSSSSSSLLEKIRQHNSQDA